MLIFFFFFFFFGLLLRKDEDDGLLERVLMPAAVGTTEYQKKIPFEVVIYTSDVKGAGTDANVFMDVRG